MLKFKGTAEIVTKKELKNIEKEEREFLSEEILKKTLLEEVSKQACKSPCIIFVIPDEKASPYEKLLQEAASKFHL